MNGALGRKFGSIGLAVDRPATRVTVSRAASNSASGAESARALQLITNEAERQKALDLRMQVLKNIGGLARGPGAEKYQNIGSHSDPNLASEESALLGTPDEIVARLKKLEAGGVDYVLLVDPSGSKDALSVFAREIMPEFPDQPGLTSAARAAHA